MQTNKTQTTIKILKDLIKGKKVTSHDYNFVINPNQYFKPIKDNGIILIEKLIKERNNLKLRSLHRDLDNVQKAKTYLLYLQHKAQ